MIYTKKLSNPGLKRITKIDGTHEDVYINDIDTNVISEGTAITDSVLETIQYKDSICIEFQTTIESLNPSPGKALIYAKPNGRAYCNIYGYEEFELRSVDVEAISKSGTTYVQSGNFGYFNLNNEVKVFSTNTKLGALPERLIETDSISDGAYIDIRADEIKVVLSNNDKAVINNNEILLTAANNELKLNQEGIKINNKSLAQIIKEEANKCVEKYAQATNHNVIGAYIQYTDLTEYDGMYYILYSDTQCSRKMCIGIKGSDVLNMRPLYKEETNSYYKIIQYIASEDSDETSYFEIYKTTIDGNQISRCFIHKLIA